jgi:hypothetical protein
MTAIKEPAEGGVGDGESLAARLVHEPETGDRIVNLFEVG